MTKSSLRFWTERGEYCYLRGGQPPIREADQRKYRIDNQGNLYFRCLTNSLTVRLPLSIPVSKILVAKSYKYWMCNSIDHPDMKTVKESLVPPLNKGEEVEDSTALIITSDDNLWFTTVFRDYEHGVQCTLPQPLHVKAKAVYFLEDYVNRSFILLTHNGEVVLGSLRKGSLGVELIKLTLPWKIKELTASEQTLLLLDELGSIIYIPQLLQARRTNSSRNSFEKYYERMFIGVIELWEGYSVIYHRIPQLASPSSPILAGTEGSLAGMEVAKMMISRCMIVVVHNNGSLLIFRDHSVFSIDHPVEEICLRKDCCYILNSENQVMVVKRNEEGKLRKEFVKEVNDLNEKISFSPYRATKIKSARK